MQTTTLIAAALDSSLGTQAWADAPEMKMSTPVPERITPATSVKNVGKGSQYAIAYLDKDGNPLDGSKTYKINLPKDVPAKDFWSFTLYDNQTRGMLQTDQRFPGVDSNKEGLKQNADGSFDVYFGPKAPAGQENYWIQTDPGKGWNTILRLYGPLESFYDKTWKPGDPELVE